MDRGSSFCPAGPTGVPLSDKLFYRVFQNNPDWILDLQPDLAPEGGYRFSAPTLEERERRLVLRALALLVEPEELLPQSITTIRGLVAGTEQAAGVADVVEGRQEAELDLTLGQLRRCCGALSPEQEPRIRAWPLPQLEALAEALLDFQGTADLRSWLKAEGWGLRAEESRVWGSIPPARSTAGSHRSQNRSGRDCAPRGLPARRSGG